MDIEIRTVTPYYKTAKLLFSDTTIDIGLLDETDCLDMAKDLIEAACTLLPLIAEEAEHTLRAILDGLQGEE